MEVSSELLSQIGLWAAAALTLVTLSYAIGDHPLFRATLYLFIGVAAGYAAAVALQDVVLPHLIYPALDEIAGAPSIDIFELGIRAGLSALLLTKLSPRTARLGNPVTALLAGIGAALAIGGAVQGTILPQIGSAAGIFDVAALDLAQQGGYYGESILIVLDGAILLIAIVSTLAYFHFGAAARGKQQPLRSIFIDVLAWVGSIFIAIALAALFSGVLLAALGALVERVAFLQDAAWLLLGTP
ncbi:MAG TPA: hypothetical protein VF982_05700 [Anaerolineales bacterium]